LGNKIMRAQDGLVSETSALNVLGMIKEYNLAPAEEVIHAVQDASRVSDDKGLNEGVGRLTKHLTPFFFPESSQKPSDESLQNATTRLGQVKSLLSAFSWLYLTQDKFYQEMELRDFTRVSAQRPQQLLLPLGFQNERS